MQTIKNLSYNNLQLDFYYLQKHIIPPLMIFYYIYSIAKWYHLLSLIYHILWEPKIFLNSTKKKNSISKIFLNSTTKKNSISKFFLNSTTKKNSISKFFLNSTKKKNSISHFYLIDKNSYFFQITLM